MRCVVRCSYDFGCFHLSFCLFLDSENAFSFLSAYIFPWFQPFWTILAVNTSSLCLCAMDENLGAFKFLSHNAQTHFLLMLVIKEIPSSLALCFLGLEEHRNEKMPELYKHDNMHLFAKIKKFCAVGSGLP